MLFYFSGKNEKIIVFNIRLKDTIRTANPAPPPKKNENRGWFVPSQLVVSEYLVVLNDNLYYSVDIVRTLYIYT